MLLLHLSHSYDGILQAQAVAQLQLRIEFSDYLAVLLSTTRHISMSLHMSALYLPVWLPSGIQIELVKPSSLKTQSWVGAEALY